jgi:hypothetical protein
MGALAEEHGFYGVENGMEGGAESLLVTDPQEAFVFHILPDDTGGWWRYPGCLGLHHPCLLLFVAVCVYVCASASASVRVCVYLLCPRPLLHVCVPMRVCVRACRSTCAAPVSVAVARL